jgi:hypothetical protein
VLQAAAADVVMDFLEQRDLQESLIGKKENGIIKIIIISCNTRENR